MLDDLKYIHEKDAQDALGVAQRQNRQLEVKFDIAPINGQFTNIVHAGMGGSALWAQLSNSWPGVLLPFEICRNYQIPTYVSERTLFIASSYSGNTEETLAALAEAEQHRAKIVVIAAGGQLSDIARQKSYPLAVLPKAEQPRFALLSGLKALTAILGNAKLIKADDAEASLKSATNFLAEAVKPWLATEPTKNNQAKQIAQELTGKSVVIYSGPLMFPVAYKWKINCNENAKQIAWCNQLPEFSHNEMIGWTEQPVQKPYAVVELRSSLEQLRIQKRFEVTERLLSGLRPAPIIIKPEGQNLLEQLIWAIALGDFVTIYLALLNGLNPTPVELVEKFKKALDE